MFEEHGIQERKERGFYDAFPTASESEYADYQRYTFTIYGVWGHEIWADEEGLIVQTPKGEEYTWIPSNSAGCCKLYQLSHCVDPDEWVAYWAEQEGLIRCSSRVLEPQEISREKGWGIQPAPKRASQCLAQFWATPKGLQGHKEKWGFIFP